MDTNQRHVLRANHQLLINNLDLQNTHVLDSLLEDGIISAGEQDEILTIRTKRDQNSNLLSVLKRRRAKGIDPYLSFLNALREDYWFISEKLRKTEQATHNRSTQLSYEASSCVHCILLKDLRPKDVTHQLFEDGVISDDDLDEINSENTCRVQGVKKLTEVLRRSVLPRETVVKCLISSLERKYNHIVTGFSGSLETIFSCHCNNNADNNSHKNNSELSKLKEEHVEEEDSKSVKQDDGRHEGGSHVQGNKIHTHRSSDKHHKIRATSSGELPTLGVVQHVPKSFPNDKKIMRLCSKLWDKLFVLREKGDWDLFQSISSAARIKYRDNADIQVLLYRSDMCISTFYSDSRENALVNFEKASTLIPFTSMPDWHLARLLPLKVELFTRSKQFDEASSLLKEAHQAMCTLSPCLSSGAVYFFEAMYLGAILRCTQGGTRSLSIRERVKTCFLTAIKHYQQEKYFKIKSFLNQVYLFLALFLLGVDVKQIDYINIHIVLTDDISLAEYYLNLFENSCWDESTDWSRMLFFIARAEQHKLRGSLRRALDYLSDAMDCADKGRFDQHKMFIDSNMALVKEGISEKLRLQAMKEHEQSVEEILAKLEQSSSDSC